MPVYRYTCKCGYNGDLFLEADKGSLVLACANCRRGVNARQVRDKSAQFKQKDGVIGVMRHD